MSTPTPYGGTLPPVTTVPEATTTVPAKPAPAETHELAFTGTDAVGIVLVLAAALIIIGLLLRWAGRNEPDLVVEGYAGTAYPAKDEA